MMFKTDKNEIFSRILPKHFYSALIEKINGNQLNEIRLRVDKPIIVYLNGQSYFVGESGITRNIGESIICRKEDIENIVFRASECSLYAVNEQIKRGYLTISNGIRIGPLQVVQFLKIKRLKLLKTSILW